MDPAPLTLDLAFQPVANPRPRCLTAAQLAAYNTHGYLMPFDAFAPGEADRNRAYFDDLLGTMRRHNDGRDAYAINGYHTRCKGIYALATHPAILDRVEDLVGPDIIAWGTHFFCKMPGDPRAVHWHQDASYWPLSPARTVTAWLAIDDADEENACMYFLPGTHSRGRLPFHTPTTPGVLWQEITDAGQYGTPVPDVLKAGQFSLHADMLAHGSRANTSTRRRCGLTIRYCPPDVVPLDAGWGQNAILCRGACANPRWRFPPPPQGEDMTNPTPPKVIGAN